MINVNQLEIWYEKNKRDLPFRENKNPYFIWVSEIMLQQTQVETVIPYFNKFIKKYPTIKSLSQTDEDTLFSVIQGLGYYRRFKNMLKAAKTVHSEYKDEFPSTYQEIRKLAGIGEYTAGAIMSIAYNKPFAATDGNVIRVIARTYDIKDDMRIEKNKKQIKLINQQLIDAAIPKIYTQAIMELGALVCRPVNPACEDCPIHGTCKAYILNKQNELPYFSKKKNKKTIKYHVFLIEDDNSLYLRKRTERLLGGMYEFPQFEENEMIPFDYEVIEDKGTYKHVFTHLIWEMKVERIKLKSEPLTVWLKINKELIKDYPMATAHKKIIN
ncbi:MAG: A/G-specific adenine glycosylase [Tenericutes bacterium]|jgi:A/G-specific adenine glycosylase|nr:A/G-specific adenine glycosylase [Mycoplasmatota bacterium]